TVLPFTAALGLPDGFARRMARNTQLILAEESNLWRVADPSAGSGAFEALTGALCEKAWGLFQTIEHEGGIVASLAAGREQA
ncbi:methylmalonyl-CoA mutase family protein, partial [Salmonella enterica]